MKFKATIWIFVLLFSACSSVDTSIDNNGAHISSSAEQALDLIPEPITVLPPPPAPKAVREQLFSVVVVKVPISEVLFTIARDAGINFDIHPDVVGDITMNAVDQTLTQILQRMVEQADIRYTVTEDLVRVVPDSPYLRTYDIDYPNMSRNADSTVSIATEVATTGMGAGDDAGGGGGGNVSSTSITTVSNNEFWQRLVDNVAAIVRGGDSLPGSSSDDGGGGDDDTSDEGDSQAGPTSIIANPESSTLSVRATHRQHVEVQTWLDRTMEHARRQVLIEATIVEVTLNDDFQAGVDWTRFADSVNGVGEGILVNQNLIGSNLGQTPVFEMQYTNIVNNALDVTSTVRMLSAFGNTKVLSSPRLMVLNNQTALLKVVDNRVYFTTNVDIQADEQGPDLIIFETEIQSVPVGFVMTVTPQINQHDTVTLNARPTLSRILRFVEDPNPEIQSADVRSLIPEIQVREMESLLRIQSGNIGVIGGLMQDSIEEQTQGIPLLSKIPGLGSLFSYDSDSKRKSELVIFIRPIVIRDASVRKDLLSYERYISP